MEKSVGGMRLAHLLLVLAIVPGCGLGNNYTFGGSDSGAEDAPATDAPGTTGGDATALTDGMATEAGGSGDGSAQKCNAATCPNGCCSGGSGGTCVPLGGESGSFCGTGGNACTACATGQACVSGQCTCNATSCPMGCCNGDTCVPFASQNSTMCGAAGACATCGSSSDSCTAGACSCGGAACSGCCNNNSCEPYANESNGSCGQNGAKCQVCTSGQQCTKAPGQTTNGQCCAVNEICDNGVDDNCDGKIDCADPQCTQTGGPNGTGQWSCATLPSGTVNGVSWSIVAFDQASSSLACPENYSGAKADYYSNAAFSSYGCQCDCSNTTPAYCKGDWCYTVDTTSCPTTSNATCVGFTTQANPSQSCNQVTAQNIADNWNFLGGPQGVVTVAGVCGATPAAQSTPAPTYDTGAACSLPQAGTGCGGSSAVCVPVASQGFATCSIAAGSVSCPDSLTAFTVYADAPTETHSCSSCSCSGNPNLSCDAWAAAYMQNTDCNGATAECDPPAGSSPAPFAYKASTCTSSGTYGCSGGADCMKSFCVAVNTTGSPTSCTANNTPSATGSVTHQGQEYTVCCP